MSTNDVQSQSLQGLTDDQAAKKVKKGASNRLSESFDSAGKIATAIAGLGVIFFANGYFVEWQRLRRGGLPPEEILALLPKAQIAAAGVRELLISLLFGAIVVVGVGYLVLPAIKRAQGSKRRLSNLFSGDVAVPTAAIAVFILLIVPLSFAGMLAGAVLITLVCYSLLLLRAFVTTGAGEKFPLWRIALAALLAALVLTGARQWEFPEPRPVAKVTLTHGGHLTGLYISIDSDSVLIRIHRGEAPALVVLNRDQIKRIRFRRDREIKPRAPSLLDKASSAIFGDSPELRCIPPECRRGGTRWGFSALF